MSASTLLWTPATRRQHWHVAMLLYILRLIDVFEILARNDDDGDAARDDHDDAEDDEA